MIVTERTALACLAALALASCTTEDGPVYDVPAREQVSWLGLEIDADGSPVILAQINMFYTTADQRGEYDPRYNPINSQTVLYSKSSGSWKNRPFRNLTAPYNNSPLLVRNERGAVQPMVWDRDRLDLYAGSGTDWRLRTRRVVKNAFPYWETGSQPNLRIIGDSGWHMVTRNEILEPVVIDENGATIRLDTSKGGFYPVEFLHGPDWIGAIGRSDVGSDTSYMSILAFYRWNRDLARPAVRKEILDSLAYPLSIAFARVRDEWRLAVIQDEENLGNWVFKGERFERLPDSPLPWTIVGGDGKIDPYRFAYGRLEMDAQGCLHKVTPIFPERDTLPPYDEPQARKFIHLNSCAAENDTLDPKIYLTGKYDVIVSEVGRVVPDGTAWYAAAVQENRSGDMGRGFDQPIQPSRIVVASKRPGGKWVFETVASY